jgi:hypothetical protein
LEKRADHLKISKVARVQHLFYFGAARSDKRVIKFEVHTAVNENLAAEIDSGVVDIVGMIENISGLLSGPKAWFICPGVSRENLDTFKRENAIALASNSENELSAETLDNFTKLCRHRFSPELRTETRKGTRRFRARPCKIKKLPAKLLRFDASRPLGKRPLSPRIPRLRSAVFPA